MRKNLRHCRQIVVKAGTGILTTATGRIAKAQIACLGREILEVLSDQKKVILVSSGAIAYGMDANSFQKRPSSMAKLQACAAIGQGRLMHAYEQFFSKKKIPTAQLLLTRDGLENRKRFLCARQTLSELLKMNALPIVNENDTVATEEIAFGDNDVLSVQVAHLMHADLLILLSDVDGFFLRDGSRIRQVSSEAEIDQVLVKHLRDVRKQRNVGGMKAKLEAARLAMKLGIPMIIVNGHQKEIIRKVLQGEDCGTLFLADKASNSSRKKWIAFSAPRQGGLILDAGAYDALVQKKRSLLPGGILKCRGKFERSQVVELETADGRLFGRGLVRYSSTEVSKIAGKKTYEIEEILGYKHQDEVIHRNDMVLWV